LIFLTECRERGFGEPRAEKTFNGVLYFNSIAFISTLDGVRTSYNIVSVLTVEGLGGAFINLRPPDCWG
jgi:hypothetical protein